MKHKHMKEQMIKSTKLEKDKAKKAKESLANFNFKIQ